MGAKMTDEEADAFVRQVKFLIAGIVLLFALPLLIYTFYLDHRIDAFEETLRHSPLEELQTDHEVRTDIYHLSANPVEGQVVYVPAYSHIYHGDGKPYLLTITLSVRNTSTSSDIVVRSVRYFDTKGKEVKSYLQNPVRLPALATTEVVVERDDAAGGSGANFLVEWHANEAVTEPIIEAVMIGSDSEQGISFARRGSVISEAKPSPAATEELQP